MFLLDAIRAYAHTDRVALVNREERLTYRELDRRSDSFAAFLLEELGEDRTPILIYGEKETAFLICMMGALKAGRGYVPIDRTVPLDRAAQIVQDVRPRLVVDLGGFDIPGPWRQKKAEELEDILSSGKTVDREHHIGPDTPAYILFTSGSTGRPKGVAITPRNLESFYNGVLPWYPAQEGGVVLHQISYSFDVSCCAVYAGLARGMTLFTVDHAMAADWEELFAALGRSGLTFWVSTPSFAELCLGSAAFTAELLPSLSRFLFCGEVLTHTLCDALAQRFPGTAVVNTYGPTEATVLVTAAEITEQHRDAAESIPIGGPIPGVALRLADEDGKELTEDGETGELLILGPSVGPGYFGRPDLTERAFFTDEKTGLRGYRTGDLCFRRDGLYYFCGRRDGQIKINGFRVELEDVEQNLQKMPNVLRATVVPVWDGEKAAYLGAFLLLKEPDGLTPLKRSIRLKKEAAAFLPSYMIPRKFIAVDAFPLGVSGKVDKKALAARLKGKSS